MRLFQFLIAAFCVVAVGCAPKVDIEEPQAGRADFSRVVVFGGSELSGYQDGALYREGQQNSIGALIGRQVQQVRVGDFVQNLLPEGVSMGLNKAWESDFIKASRLGDRTDCEGEVSLGPVRDTVSVVELEAAGVWDGVGTEINDFSVPFAGLWDLTSASYGGDLLHTGTSAFATRFPFAYGQTSALDDALGSALSNPPTFFVMWPGMTDIYNWARQGGYRVNLPDPAAFRTHLDSILTAFDGVGAQGVLATLPDIGHFPYFTTIPSRALELNQAKADSLNAIYALGGANVGFQAGENGFIVADPGTPSGFRQLAADEYITLSVPLDSMKCYFMGVLFTLMPDRYTLIQRELDLLRNYTAQYNQAIIDLAAQHDLAVADMAGFYADLDAGIRVDGVDFDASFVSGGFFSLDGWHANPKGAGLLANEYITAINAHYGATIPTVSLHMLRGVLFP